MKKGTNRDPIAELTQMLKTVQEKEKMQDRMVRKFQKLIRDEGLSSSTFKDFPYPLAIFEQDGDLVFVNSVLAAETGLDTPDLAKAKYSILSRITDANLQILDAEENVFRGKTTFLTGLTDPLEIFMSESLSRKRLSSSDYREAVFFPISDDEGQTTQGAVIFLR